MPDLENLKQAEEILAFSYWENFKWSKDMAQALGGTNERVKKSVTECEKIRLDWVASTIKLKEYERTN